MRAVRFKVIGPENAYGPTRNTYGPTRNAYDPAKTMRTNFVAKMKMEKKWSYDKMLIDVSGRAGQENIWLEVRTHGPSPVARNTRDICMKTWHRGGNNYPC